MLNLAPFDTILRITQRWQLGGDVQRNRALASAGASQCALTLQRLLRQTL
jgi:hypothetical protein